MIIVDGMDNTGKTTLAYTLCEEFGLTYLHSPSEYKYDFSRMVDWAIIQLGSRSKAVYDRFSPITDLVYGPELRGGTPYLSNPRAKAVLELLKHTPHLIIYARPPREKIFNFGERDQMEGVIDNAERLLDRYDGLVIKLAQQGFGIVRYDYTRDSGTASLGYIYKLVEKHIEEYLN